MSYAKRCHAAAEKIMPVLKKANVEEKYLRFDGSIELPKRIAAPTQSDSKFQAEQALGDWAEDALCDAINKLGSEFIAVHYGDNNKMFAEDPGFRDAYKAGIVETFTTGKRADLLLLPKKSGAPLDLTSVDHKTRDNFVKKSIGALEVRSSRLSADVYRKYQAARVLEKKKPTHMEPNFTLKVEDLIKVFLWIHINDRPQAYVQVFFDEVHAIGFATMLEYIGSARKLVVDKHDRSDKTTIMIPISEGKQVGEVSQPPLFQVEHNLLQSGRHDIFARPKGGALTVDINAVLASLQ